MPTTKAWCMARGDRGYSIVSKCSTQGLDKPDASTLQSYDTIRSSIV